MAWKTYLVMFFEAGTKIKEVVERVESLGFRSSLGPVDFIYDWGEEQPDKKKVLELADELSEILTNTGAIFNIDTHD